MGTGRRRIEAYILACVVFITSVSGYYTPANAQDEADYKVSYVEQVDSEALPEEGAEENIEVFDPELPGMDNEEKIPAGEDQILESGLTDTSINLVEQDPLSQGTGSVIEPDRNTDNCVVYTSNDTSGFYKEIRVTPYAGMAIEEGSTLEVLQIEEHDLIEMTDEAREGLLNGLDVNSVFPVMLRLKSADGTISDMEDQQYQVKIVLRDTLDLKDALLYQLKDNGSAVQVPFQMEESVIDNNAVVFDPEGLGTFLFVMPSDVETGHSIPADVEPEHGNEIEIADSSITIDDENDIEERMDADKGDSGETDLSPETQEVQDSDKENEEERENTADSDTNASEEAENSFEKTEDKNAKNAKYKTTYVQQETENSSEQASEEQPDNQDTAQTDTEAEQSAQEQEEPSTPKMGIDSAEQSEQQEAKSPSEQDGHSQEEDSQQKETDPQPEDTNETSEKYAGEEDSIAEGKTDMASDLHHDAEKELDEESTESEPQISPLRVSSTDWVITVVPKEPEGIQLAVEEIADPTLYGVYANAINGQNIRLFDIKLLKNGEKVQQTTQVDMEIEGMENAHVIHFPSDPARTKNMDTGEEEWNLESGEELKIEQYDGHILFTVNDFSVFAVYQERPMRLRGTKGGGLRGTGNEICKIIDANGTTYEFETLADAVTHTQNNADDYIDGYATIEMLKDYVVTSGDKMTLTNTDSIILTTASTGFTDTLANKETDDIGKAVLSRGWNGGTTDTAALIYLQDSGVTLITRNIVFNGMSGGTQYTGRAIYRNDGLLKIEDGSTFRHFTTAANGGAVYTSDWMEIRNLQPNGHILFDSCTGTNGGAAYHNGGYLCLMNVYSNDSIIFSNCRATSTSNNQDGGGALCIPDNNVAIRGGYDSWDNGNKGLIRFYNCSAARSGGAIKCCLLQAGANEGTIEFESCSAEGTNSTEDTGSGGGAICFCGYNSDYVNSWNLIDSQYSGRWKFTNCTSQANGGAIALYNNNYGTEIYCNSTTYTASFIGCTAQMHGGAIFQRPSIQDINIWYTDFGDPNDATKRCRAVNGSGGAVYGSGSIYYLNNGAGSMGCYYAQSKGSGGAIYNTISGTTTRSMYGGKVVMKGCESTDGSGGAFYSSDRFELTVDEVSGNTGEYEFDQCRAQKGNGGAIFCSRDSLILSFGTLTFNQCSAIKGGAVCTNIHTSDSILDSVDILVMANSSATFTECTATNGGAVWAYNTCVGWDNYPVAGTALFEDCSATNGGAIYVTNRLWLCTGTGTTTFDTCTATNGGAVYSSQADTGDDVTIEVGVWGSTPVYFTECAATNNGGAFCAPDHTYLYIARAEITDGSAANGGAVYIGNTSNSGPFIQNTEITGCEATQGGAVWSSSKEALSLKGNVRITGNSVTGTDREDGGGIYLDPHSSLEITEATYRTDSIVAPNIYIYNNQTADNKQSNLKTGAKLYPISFTGSETVTGKIGIANPTAAGKVIGTSEEQNIFGNALATTIVDDTGVYTAEYRDNGYRQVWGTGQTDLVCKVTAANGALLKRNGQDAVYQSLTEAIIDVCNAFDEDEGTYFYNASGSKTTPANIEMLVEEYTLDIMMDIPVNFEENVKFTIKTAARGNGAYDYPQNATNDKCVLKKGHYNDAAFTVDWAEMIFENLVLDGQNRVSPTSGGFITSEEGGLRLTVKNCTVQNMKSSASGGFAYAYESDSSDSGWIKIIDSTLTGGSAGGNGGFICAETYNSVELTNSTLQNVTAGGSGGAVYAVGNYGTISSNGSTFSNCTANGSGGAIYTTKQPACTFTNTIVQNCTAKVNGGGISINNTSNTATLEGCTFTGCKSLATGVSIGDLTTSTGCGGAVYTTKAITLRNCAFTGNEAPKEGGAVCYNGTSAMYVYGCNFTECKISLNDVPSSYNKYVGGGALFYFGGSSSPSGSLTIGKYNNKRTTFTDCRALISGGAISFVGANMTTTDTDFLRCNADVLNGGAVNSYTYSGVKTFTDCTFTNCVAKGYNPGTSTYYDPETAPQKHAGGAICGQINLDYEQRTMMITRCQFNACSADKGVGGAVTAHEAITLTDSTITNCTAYRAAAVQTSLPMSYDHEDIYNKTITLNNSTITGNVSAISGAVVVENDCCEIIVSGGTVVTGNTCNGHACNVSLDYDSNTIIKATDLTEDAEIGVYVIDDFMGKRGKAGRIFATYTNSAAHLDAFVNDRETDSENHNLRGIAFSDNRVCWPGQSVTLTLTDTNDQPIADARFELSYLDKQGDTYKIFSGRTDTNGELMIPWCLDGTTPGSESVLASTNDGGACAFDPDKTYLIKEIDVNRPYIRPAGYWKITTENSGITVRTAQADEGNYTYAMTQNTEYEWSTQNSIGPLTVTYNLQDGTWTENTTQVFTFTKNATKSTETIPATLPEKSGYTFLCWNNRPDGSGAFAFAPGQKVWMGTENPITLYAIWTTSQYVARVIDNNGTVTYHEALVDSASATYNGVTVKRGAFDYANSLSGNVIIETFKTAPGTGRTSADESSTYVLNASSTFTFSNAKTKLTIRSMPGIGFESTIKKDRTPSLITIGSSVTELVVQNLKFDGNNGSRIGNSHGGILNISSHTTTLKDCEFKNATISGSYNGGAVYFNGSYASEADVLGCRFNNCHCRGSSSSYHGGALYATFSHLVIDETEKNESSFTDCTSYYNGGALQLSSSAAPIHIRNTKFIRCKAGANGGAGSGGAIYTTNYQTYATNCLFEDCTALYSNGGGLCIYYNSNETTSTFTSYISKCTFRKGTGMGCMALNGGGLYFFTKKPNAIYCNSCNFTNCYAGRKNSSGTIEAAGNGGAVYTKYKPEFRNCNFGEKNNPDKGCEAFSTSATTGYGGALYTTHSFIVIDNYSNTECGFYYCKANKGGVAYTTATSYSTGRAIELFPKYSYSSISIENCTSQLEGGVAYLTSGSAYIDGSGTVQIKNCSSGNASGAATGEGGVFYIVNGNARFFSNKGRIMFINCHSNGGTKGGGVAYVTGSLLISDNAGSILFDNCGAARSGQDLFGGAIRATAGVNISNNTGTIRFNDCHATGGGALYLDSGTFTIEGSGTTEFVNCTSDKAGGAIRKNAGTTMTLTNVSFENCVAGSGGGAVYTNSASSEEKITGCTFTKCKSTGTNGTCAGGAIWRDTGGSAGLAVTDSIFDRCEAIRTNTSNGYNGGAAIYMGRGNLTIIGTSSDTMTITGCKADPDVATGGAINVASGLKMYFKGGMEITDNTSGNDQHNVVLNENVATAINTTTDGIQEGSRIGIYVTDTAYANRGAKFKTFGTYATSSENMDAFVNDRNMLVGEAVANTTNINWSIGYKLVLDPNGGDGDPVSVNLGYFKEYALKNPYTKEGFLFKEWNTRKDGTGDSYYASDIVSRLTEEENTTVTLYAQWHNPETCDIIFHPNGGKEVETRTVIKGTKLGLLPATERDGYTFLKWKWMKNGTEMTMTENTVVNEDMDLYASWQKNIYITFDPNGGIVGEEVREMKPGKIGSLPRADQPSATKLDYQFDGWYNEAGNKVTENSTFTEDETLTAHWKIWARKLRYDTNGGLPNANIYGPLTEDLQYTIPWFPELTNHGYTLDGWYSSRTGGTKYEIGDVIDLRYNDAVHARWIKNEEITITFDADGGSACESVTIFKGDKIAHLPTTTKDGYTFLGWYDSNDQLVTRTTVPSDSITLTAKWEAGDPVAPKEYVTITFNNGGTTTTQQVEKGTPIRNFPGPSKENYYLDGWYDNPDFTGNKLTADTVMTTDKTYYAKWEYGMVDVNGTNYSYQYQIIWTTPTGGIVTNLGDTLHYYSLSSETASATMHFYFKLKDSTTVTVPECGIRIRIPKTGFENWSGAGLGTEDIVTAIPRYPDKRSGFDWSYIDDGDAYVMVNNIPFSTGELTINPLDYTAGTRYIKSGVFDESGVLTNNYSAHEIPITITIDGDLDGTPEVTIAKSLYTEVYTEQTPVSANRGGTNVYRTWQSTWGTEPADSDEYYYVKWSHGNISASTTTKTGHDYSTPSTLTATWIPDEYDVVYENGYIVTKHRYDELVNAKTKLYKSEHLTRTWEYTEEEREYEIPCNIDFSVSEPSPPTHSSDSVTGLSGSKYIPWLTDREYTAGQDRLLDDQKLGTSIFELSMTGPGEDNLEQKGDSTLYYAKEYTVIIRDGQSGDVYYTSSNVNNQPIKLGENDYNFTRLSVSVSNSDGYLDDGWHSLGNTAYSSWKPIEIWLRRKGEGEYYKYADVFMDGSSSKSIALPDDTVGYEVRHTTFYWSTSLHVSPTLYINPTSHVKMLVRKDYDTKINSYFYNIAQFEARRVSDDELLYSTRSGTYIYANKSKTGLRISKSTGSVTNNVLEAIQTIPVTTTGYHYNNSGIRKPIYAGTFYELLPLGTIVDESTVYAEAESGRLSRNNVNVEYIPNWKNTGQTMMAVSVGLPDGIKTNSIAIHYQIKNTYENIFDEGYQLYIPSAFVNTTKEKEIYEITKQGTISSITSGTALFNDLETTYGDYVAYAGPTANFLPINSYSAGFRKTVNTLNEFTDNTSTLANREYTYRLTYSQSEIAVSDNLIFFDVLDGGSSTSTSDWHGTLIDVNTSKVAEMVSYTDQAKCNPVVWYSTQDRDLFTDNDFDLSLNIWSTTKPTNNADITAIAIDCSKTVNGSDFVLKAKNAMNIYVRMLSPKNAVVGENAVNEARTLVRTFTIYDDPTDALTAMKSQTSVTMKNTDPVITMTSDPVSGTELEPRLVAYKDTVNYDLAVTNNDTEFNYTDICIEDILPPEVSIELNHVYVYTDNPANAVKISNSARASMTSDQNTLSFLIHELLPGETLHIVIPTIVETREAVFTNQATLVSVNTLEVNDTTDTTWHEVKRYQVNFEKKIENTSTFLPGATLQLLDSGNNVMEEWVSGAEAHTILLGADEYKFREVEPADNYDTADLIRFTLSREGEITTGGQALYDRTLVMYDRFIAVDTIITCSNDNDPDQAFEYVARITGLKPYKTYYSWSDVSDNTGQTPEEPSTNQEKYSFTADSEGTCNFRFTLKDGEREILEYLPTGAQIAVTQVGTNHYSEYDIVEAQQVVKHGETSVSGQDLTTKEIEVDIDKGITYFNFTNTPIIPDTIKIRVIVVDENGKPIIGSALAMETPSDTIRSWVSTDDYETITLDDTGTYTITQSSVPEHLLIHEPVELTIVDGTITANNSLSGSPQSGYVVTIVNRSRAFVTVQNLSKDTEFFLPGAEFTLKQGNQTIKEWTSGSKGTTLYFDPDTTYTVTKTRSPDGHEAVGDTEVTIVVDQDNQITTTPSKIYRKDTVTFYDRAVITDVTLTVSNTIAGNMGDKTKQFTFTVSGLEANGSYAYEKTANRGGRSITEIGSGTLEANGSGEIEFTLGNREKIDLTIPANSLVTVSEDSEAYTAYHSIDNTELIQNPQTESLTMDADRTVDYTNNLNAAVPTGVQTNKIMWIIIVTCGIFAAVLILTKKRKIKRIQ